MIDWVTTESSFGLTPNHFPMTNVSRIRPKVNVVCQCGKKSIIAIRKNSDLDHNKQRAWLCPSCVNLNRSQEISKQVVNNWKTKEYRKNQLDKKNSHAYKQIQSSKAANRWRNNEYRQQLMLSTEEFVDQCTSLHGDRFDYRSVTYAGRSTKIKITCNTCGYQFERLPLNHIDYGACPKCNITNMQRNLIEFIEEFGYHALANDRTAISPLEIDIFVPDLMLGIECHGLYWHSYASAESTTNKQRHQNKAIACTALDIKLFQFFDYEWKRRPAIIMSMLQHAIGRSDNVNARELKVVKLTNSEAEPFFNDNHLYGHRAASTIIGLKDNNGDTLIAASFSKHNDGFEIIRLATKLGFNVRGGAARLITNFKRIHPEPLYTFADLRYSTGNVYRQLGFKDLHTTKPGYFYYKGKTILSRLQCQKHKLQSLLNEWFDPELSEPENMFKCGYRRVWDAGHVKLVLK